MMLVWWEMTLKTAAAATASSQMQKADSSDPESAVKEHASAPAVEDPQLGGLQSSGEARPLGQVDDLSGTSVSSGSETEGHEDVNSDDTGKSEPLTSSADASLPQSDEEGQEACAEEACAQHERQPPVSQQLSTAAHRERHACDNTNDDAEQLREQYEQQNLQGNIQSPLASEGSLGCHEDGRTVPCLLCCTLPDVKEIVSTIAQPMTATHRCLCQCSAATDVPKGSSLP